ncbi:transporter substrate-binding domain-containing protein [Crassaminicella thermophila]|nr:transporter substrate-binding domain-containing protein [Crassaminicella thermophila]
MRRNKEILCIISIVFMFIGYGNLYAEEKDVYKETIIVGGDNYFPPFEYVDKNGVYKGFNVDILRAIAIEMGIDLDIRPMPWYEAIMALNEREIDAIQGMKYSISRSYLYDFSDPYLVSSQSIFVRSDNSYIVNIEDLEKKKIAIQKNDIAKDVLKNIMDIQIIETENQQMALKKLIKGEVDAYIGNRLTGLYIIQKDGYTKDVKIVGEEINPLNYGIVVNKGNKVLLKMFNEGLMRIKKNGTYDKIYKKWFGEPINPPYAYIKRTLYFSIVVLFFSLFGIFIFYRWNYLLKKEVNKRTQQLKRESLFKEQIINSIFSGLITFNNQGIILSANEKAAYFLDMPIEAFVKKHFKDTVVKEYFYEEDFYEVLQTGKEKMNIEKNINVEGINKVFEYNIYPLVLHEDDVYGITLTFKDITNEKLMKERMIMKDKLESLGRLVAGIAHEIRNPLTSIKAYIELIPYKYDKKEFREKISEDVPKEIERLNSIISNLLEYAKPKVPNKEMVKVHDEILGIIVFFSNQIKKKNIKLICNMKEDLFIYVDKQQFKQIMINFLLNAIEAFEKTENPEICITAEKNGDFAVIIIKDNGCGIASENEKKIFEPFFTTKDNGTGLGLSISYQFIKENGGDITVSSHLETGTKINMILPLFKEKRSTANV